MTDINFRSDFDVDYIQHMGDDEMICKAARVSTLGAGSIDSKESEGLLNFLMSNRHGSPFEHAAMTVRITAPIFVWREYMRHRIGHSYNEESGRYKELDPVFYIPPEHRPLVQEGKPGAYEFVHGSDRQITLVEDELKAAYAASWEGYTLMLSRGIAKEVARMCLPTAIYSTAYVTVNPRSLMSFLSLRTKDLYAKFPSYPMWEIEQVAQHVEQEFKERFPTTWTLFREHGSVSP